MTKEEIINAIADDKMMPFIQPEQLAGIVDFVIKNYNPSLPSNLDEAANMYGLKSAHGEDNYCAWWHRDGFKAGAEWMAGQFEKNHLAACDAQTNGEHGRETELEDEIRRYVEEIMSADPKSYFLENIARHFAEWGAKHLKK